MVFLILIDSVWNSTQITTYRINNGYPMRQEDPLLLVERFANGFKNEASCLLCLYQMIMLPIPIGQHGGRTVLIRYA